LPRSNTDPQRSDQQLLRLGPKYNWTKVQPVYPSTGSLSELPRLGADP